jgi:hypothetical protein
MMASVEATEEKIYPDFIYMTIPAEWACLYQKLLVAVADYGEQMLGDCKASCKDPNRSIINCWHMFSAAVAAHNLGKDKLAETLIKYIRGQLKIVYRGQKCADYDTGAPVSITPEGDLKALVKCGDETEFIVDTATGELYREYTQAGEGGE